MFASESVITSVEHFDQIALDERLKYKSIYIAIEDYIAQYAIATDPKLTPDVIIAGGSMSIALLLGKHLTRDDFTYELFSEAAFKHANALTNKLAELVPTDTSDPNKPFWIVSLKTLVPYKKFDITLDQRPFVRFTTLNRMSETITVYDMIQPLTVKSYFEKRSILIMPPKFHLIDIYQSLYSPASADDWSEQLHEEQRLFGYMRKIMDLQARGKTVKVGAASGETRSVSPEGPLEFVRHPQRNQIALKILQEIFVDNPKIILLGEHAINMLTGASIDTPIIHCMLDPDLSVADIIHQIQPIVTKVLGRPLKLSHATRNVQILGDFRLRRTSIKLGDSKEIMYCYNATDYDLIPFNRTLNKSNQSIQIGSPFVLLRFMLIELWVLVWISSLGKIEKNFALARSNSLIMKVLQLRTKISLKNKSSIDPIHLETGSMQIFQTSSQQYLGIYQSEQVAQKTKAQTAQRFHEYFPQEWIKKHSTFRAS